MTFLNGRQILDNSIALVKLIAGGTRDATTFLRGDGVFAVPPGGGGGTTINDLTLDFGSVPVDSQTFIVTDPLCSPSSKIRIDLVGIGDGRDSDELEWEMISCVAIPGTGEFTVIAKASDLVFGNYNFIYSL